MYCRTIYFGRLLLISAAALVATVSPARPQIATPIIPVSGTRDYVFPPVGLASSETASITVANTATSSSSSSSSVTGTPPSCTGTISFSNASGAIGTPAPFTVGSGGLQTVTLSFASAGLTGNRGEIQGRVSLAISSTAPAPCSLMLSLETYDSTTFATHAVLSNATTILAAAPGRIMLPLVRN
jgi:hypothetical protein